MQNYKGPCEFYYVNGSHNELREDAIYEKVCSFFKDRLPMKDYKDSFELEESKIQIEIERRSVKENSKIIMESVRSKSSKSSMSEKSSEDLRNKIRKLFKTFFASN